VIILVEQVVRYIWLSAYFTQFLTTRQPHICICFRVLQKMVSSCGGFEDYLWRGINDSSDFFKFIDMEAITNQVLDSFFTFNEKSIA